MKTPRTVEELAALVVITADKTLEESVKDNNCAKAFHESLRDQDLRLIFLFLVLAVNLEKSKDRERQELALLELQNRVFSNASTGIPKIRFRDTDNAIEEIFRWALPQY